MTLTDKLDKFGICVKKATDSFWFVLGVNLFVLFCWIFNLLFLGVAAIILSFLTVFFTQKNLNSLLPVLASAIFIVSDTGGSAGNAAVRPQFFDALEIVLYCCLPLLLTGLVYFFVKNKIKPSVGGVAQGLIVFFAVALFAGAGTEYYSLELALKTLLFCLAIFGAYVLFWSGLDFSEKNFKKMFALSFGGAAIVVAAEVFIAFLRQGSGVFVGWGNGGTAGQILAMYLPFLFYLVMSAKNKREIIICYLAMAFIAGGLFLSRSRSAILALLILAVPLFLVTHKKLQPNLKKTNLILLAGMAVAALLICVILSDWIAGEIKSILAGSGDITSGRTSIWADGWNSFKQSPVLGKGFAFKGASGGIKFEEGFIFIYWYHNTLLQILVNTGLAGFAAFCFFMYKKYQAAFQKGDIFKFFLFAGLVIAEIQGLFDPHVVALAHSIFMLLFVAAAEHMTEAINPAQKEVVL